MIEELTMIKAERFAKRLTDSYSIHSGVLYRLEKIKDRFPRVEHYKFLKKVVQALEETIPGQYDVKLNFKVDIAVHRNMYGHNLALNVFDFNRFTINTSLYTDVYIRYPEFIINNNKNQTHTIKELVIKLPIDINHEKIEDLVGTRFRISPAEFVSLYAHSHLPGCRWVERIRETNITWLDFCTGTGDYEAARSIVNSSEDADIDMIKLMLFNLEPLVTYESIETTPYRYIENISVRENSEEVTHNIGAVFTTYKDTFWTLCKRYINTNETLDLNWSIIDNKGYLIDDDAFEDFCRKVFETYLPTMHFTDIMYYKDETDSYVLINDSNRFDRGYQGYHRHRYIIFQGQRLETYVEELEESSTEDALNDTKIYINPKIKEYVKSKLEQYTSDYLSKKVRQSAIERLQNTHRG